MLRILTILLFLPTFAFAQSPEPQTRLYLGGAYVDASGDLSDGRNLYGQGFEVTLGLKLNDYFSFEAAYGLVDYDAFNMSEIRFNAAEADIFSASVVTRYPSDGFSPFIRLGVSRFDIKAKPPDTITADDRRVIWGFGLDYNMTPRLIGRLAFNGYEHGDTAVIISPIFRF